MVRLSCNGKEESETLLVWQRSKSRPSTCFKAVARRHKAPAFWRPGLLALAHTKVSHNDLGKFLCCWWTDEVSYISKSDISIADGVMSPSNSSIRDKKSLSEMAQNPSTRAEAHWWWDGIIPPRRVLKRRGNCVQESLSRNCSSSALDNDLILSTSKWLERCCPRKDLGR